MTGQDELLTLVAQYRAGLEAEVSLLHRLEAIAVRQRETTAAGELASLAELADARDTVMASLVKVESELKPVRDQLVEAREQLEGAEGFEELKAMHRTAARLVADILGADERSVEALKEAERARRLAAEDIEKRESTLAAYRRVVAPRLTSASLVDRRG